MTKKETKRNMLTFKTKITKEDQQPATILVPIMKENEDEREIRVVFTIWKENGDV